MRIFIILLLIAFEIKAEDFKIGWIGPLTGNAAVLGIDSLNALELAVNETDAKNNEQKPKIVAEDDQYQVLKSVLSYERLVHKENIKVIFLLTYGAYFTLAERAKKDNVLLIDTLDCDEELAKLNSNIFCIAKTTEHLGEMVGRSVKANKGTPSLLLTYASDPFMSTLAKHAIKGIENQNTSSYIEEYNKETTDFRTTLLRAKTKGIKSIIFFGYDEMAFAIQLCINKRS